MRVDVHRHRDGCVNACWESVGDADPGDATADDVQHAFSDVGEVAQQQSGEVNTGVGKRVEVHPLTVVTRQRER